MAKQIIALTKSTDGTTLSVTAAMWFPITAGAKPVTANSAWTGASAAENTAIQNGSVLEEVRTFSFSVGEAAATIKATMQQAWTARNGQLNGIGPNVYNGIFFDSATGWSA